MAYVKKDWHNLPLTDTPITDDDLDRIENGIEENDKRLNGTKPIDNTIYANDFKCKNLFNKNSWYKAYIDSANGQINSSNNAGLFNYIEVNQNTEYSISFNRTITDCKVAYYTDNKTWISSSNSITSSTKITTPSNCKYIRIYINVDGNGIDQAKIDSINFQVEIGEATPYTTYKNFDNTPNAIVISRNGNEDINITTAYQHKTVSLDTVFTKIGDKLTYNASNKSIVIGSGVHHIEVSACVVMSHSSNSVTDRYFSIRKNSNDFVSGVYQYLNIPANYTYVLNIPPIITDVNEGDEIYATVTSGITETISIKGSTIKRVFLNAKVID